MAPSPGRLFLLKTKEEASEDFITLAGMRSTGFDQQQEKVDISNKDTSTWAVSLAGAGTKSANISASGVFYNSASEALFRSRFGTETHYAYQIILPGAGTYEGLFMIESIAFAGEHNGETNYTISLASDGDITFTPE